MCADLPFSERVLAEESPTFVDRHRMANNLHVWILPSIGEWEPHRVVHPTYRADGVPNSYKVDDASSREGVFEPAHDFKIEVPTLEPAQGVRDEAFIPKSQ